VTQIVDDSGTIESQFLHTEEDLVDTSNGHQKCE